MEQVENKPLSGAQALLQALVDQGVQTLFGYPGGGVMPVYDELLNFPQLRHILTRHEQGAVHAAQGFARASGGTGVCLVTSGPGATNLLTGIADAMLDSTPVVCIASQVPSTALGTDFFQEADMINMTIPTTKWNYQITRHQEIAPVLAKAFYIAGSGRPGPVYIEVSKDALLARGEYRWEPCTGIRSYKPDPEIDIEDIARAWEMIREAERPLILVGNGVKISGAEQAVLRLAQAGNIPIASTLMGLSAVPSDHPLYVGMLGMHGHVAPNRMTQEADLLLAIGMRFSDRVTGHVQSYAPKARIIHIEIDPVEIGKNVRVDLAINADARRVLEHLVGDGTHIRPKERPGWFAQAAQWKEQEWERVVSGHLHPARAELSMGEVVAAVAQATAGEAVVVTDVGQQQMLAARYSRYTRTRSLITSGGLGTMGYGLPASIGAKVAVGAERQVVAFLGDGGFQMTMQELGTILQEQIGVKIVVLNNSFLGMVRQWQQLFFDRRYSSTPLVNPDFVALAGAYNLPAERVVNRDELPGAVDRMLSAPGPYFLEAVVYPEDNVFPMVPAGAALQDALYNE